MSVKFGEHPLILPCYLHEMSMSDGKDIFVNFQIVTC